MKRNNTLKISVLLWCREDAWRRNLEFLKAVEFLSEDKQEEAGKLIQELGLLFLGAENNPL